MVQVIKEFGFSSLKLTENDFLEEGMILQLRMEPNRIDIICGIEGFRFDHFYKNLEVFENEDLKLNFVNKKGLKLTKTIAGRTKDLADLEELGLIERGTWKQIK